MRVRLAFGLGYLRYVAGVDATEVVKRNIEAMEKGGGSENARGRYLAEVAWMVIEGKMVSVDKNFAEYLERKFAQLEGKRENEKIYTQTRRRLKEMGFGEREII